MAGKDKKALRFIPAQAISRLVFNLRVPDEAVRRILVVVLEGGTDASELAPAEEVIATNILDEIASYNTRYDSRVKSHRDAQRRYRQRLTARDNPSDEVTSSDITGHHAASSDISNPSDTGTERNGTDVPNIRGTVSPPPPSGGDRVTVTRFKVPSLDEVASYFEQRGASRREAEKFHDHYEANGWKVGRSPMKDWRAAVRNWLREDSFSRGDGAAPEKKMAAPPAQGVQPLPFDGIDDEAAAFRARMAAEAAAAEAAGKESSDV